MSEVIEPVTGVAATQYGLLIRALAEPEAGHGVNQVVLDFDEDFDAASFEQALRALVSRHGGLRTGFDKAGGAYRQWVASDAVVENVVLDRAAGQPDAEWATLVAADRRRGFDLSAPPLVRSACILLPGARGRVLLSYHHMIMDGVARELVLAELVGRYDAFRSSVAYKAPTLDLATSGEVIRDRAAASAYWRATLAGLGPDSPLTALRTPRKPDASLQTYVSRQLDRTTTDRLRAVSSDLGCSLATLVYAAWALCLNRVSQDADIAFLAIRNARADAGRGALRAVASLVYSAPLRIAVDRTSSFSALVAAMDDAWRSATPHADVPLSDIRHWGECDRRVWDCNILFHHGRFAAAFARSAASGGSRRIETLGSSDTPLTVAVMRGAAIEIHMRYWVEAFRPGAVDTLADSLAAILEGIAHDPDARLADLPYLGTSQRGLLQNAASGAEAPSNALLHGAFEEWARREPDRIAIDEPGGGLSYGAVDQAANALASLLIAQGVLPEEPVALLAERSAAHLVAMLATLKAGAACLPLDPSHPDAHLARIVKAAGASRVLASPAQGERGARLGREIVVTPLPVVGGGERPLLRISPSALAYMIATGGTTGEAKIVEVEHRAAANTLHHSLAGIYEPLDLAVVPWTDSPAADAAIHQIFAPLGAGGTLVPLSGLDALKASPRFNDFTAFGATPSMLGALLAAGGLPPNLRAVMFGGESCPEALVGSMRAQTGIRRAVNVYGPTEAAIYCTANDVMACSGDGEQGRIIGRPIANIRTELFDDTGQPTVPGAAGELCIAGVGLARGYRDSADARFTERTGVDGTRRRYYRTGDMAVLLPDGRLEFLGRRDRQAKVRGVRIELDAVERAIEALPGVSRALVETRADGPGAANRLIAWIVAAADPDTVRAALRQTMPAAMVPSACVVIDEVPLTRGGKPDYRALATPPGAAAVGAEVPSNDAERVVADAWRGLLGHERFGVHDEFFDVGGDSLMGMELLLRIGELFGTRVAPADLDRGWTVAAMARAAAVAAPADSFDIVGEGLPGTPIFWIMPSVLDLTILQSVSVQRPIYMATTDSLESSGESFEAFGRAMAKRIRAVQRRGPYRIGGFCIGACAAFEAAAALAAMGEDVERLALVDRTVRGGPMRGLSLAVSRREIAGAWRRRHALLKTFAPSGVLDTCVVLTLTRHGAWRPGALRRWAGWRQWVRGSLVVERRPLMASEDGVRRAVLALSASRP